MYTACTTLWCIPPPCRAKRGRRDKCARAAVERNYFKSSGDRSLQPLDFVSTCRDLKRACNSSSLAALIGIYRLPGSSGDAGVFDSGSLAQITSSRILHNRRLTDDRRDASIFGISQIPVSVRLSRLRLDCDFLICIYVYINFCIACVCIASIAYLYFTRACARAHTEASRFQMAPRDAVFTKLRGQLKRNKSGRVCSAGLAHCI